MKELKIGDKIKVPQIANVTLTIIKIENYHIVCKDSDDRSYVLEKKYFEQHIN